MQHIAMIVNNEDMMRIAKDAVAFYSEDISRVGARTKAGS